MLPPPSHPSLAPAPSSSASWRRDLPLKWGTRPPACACPALPPYGLGCGSRPPTPLQKECTRYTVTARRPAHRAALLGGPWGPPQPRRGYVSVCTHLPAARAGRRDGHRRERLWRLSGAATRHRRHTARPSPATSPLRPAPPHARGTPIGQRSCQSCSSRISLAGSRRLRSQPATAPRCHPADDTATVGLGRGLRGGERQGRAFDWLVPLSISPEGGAVARARRAPRGPGGCARDGSQRPGKARGEGDLR